MNKITSGANKDIYIIQANGGFTPGASVVVTLTGDIDRTVAFSISSASVEAPTDFGFESGTLLGGAAGLPSGWVGFGDIDVIEATGSISPSEGSRLLAMSSGSALGRGAIADASSLVASGLFELDGATTLRFTYNFQSSEFNDFCASPFDDSFVVAAAGPDGAIAELVDSVNIICAAGTQQTGTFPTQPDAGDSVYQESGEQEYALSLAGLGEPLSISFVITDVGDTIYTSVVGIDDIRLE